MSEKYEWRKKEKELYIPKRKPVIIDVPEFSFITVRGAGSPANSIFTESIGALYSVAYGIKMRLKQRANKPHAYCDYTVYPLEGIWDINDAAKTHFTGSIAKEDLIYQLMIRQPKFVTNSLFENVLVATKEKKPSPLLDLILFESMADEKCIQMLHIGPFEDEQETFEIMEAFANQNGLVRVSKVHREIYLSDVRKVAPEKLKTVLRFKVE